MIIFISAVSGDIQLAGIRLMEGDTTEDDTTKTTTAMVGSMIRNETEIIARIIVMFPEALNPELQGKETRSGELLQEPQQLQEPEEPEELAQFVLQTGVVILPEPWNLELLEKETWGEDLRQERQGRQERQKLQSPEELAHLGVQNPVGVGDREAWVWER